MTTLSILLYLVAILSNLKEVIKPLVEISFTLMIMTGIVMIFTNVFFKNDSSVITFPKGIFFSLFWVSVVTSLVFVLIPTNNFLFAILGIEAISSVDLEQAVREGKALWELFMEVD